MSLRVVPVSFAAACAFVAEHHRHHQPPRGHKFSLGVAVGEMLVGVAIVGRPVSRVIQAEGDTLELTRTATDGTPNANSMLYGAAWRAAKGARLPAPDHLHAGRGETGSSLRAAGFQILGERRPRAGWSVPSRPREGRGTDDVARTLWEVAS